MLFTSFHQDQTSALPESLYHLLDGYTRSSVRFAKYVTEPAQPPFNRRSTADKSDDNGVSQGSSGRVRAFLQLLEPLASDIDCVDRSSVSDILQRVFIQHDQIRRLSWG